MNKNLLIGAVVAVVVIGGGATAYMLTKEDKPKTNNLSQTQNSTEQKDSTNESQTTTSASISKLLTENKNRECTFSFDDAGSAVKGTSYFTGGERMRMNYKSTKDGITQDGSMIITKAEQTIWDNSSKQGFKFAFDANSTPTQQQGPSTDKDINFSCKNWSVDESVFTVPGDVKVTNFADIQVPTIPTQ